MGGKAEAKWIAGNCGSAVPDPYLFRYFGSGSGKTKKNLCKFQYDLKAMNFTVFFSDSSICRALKFTIFGNMSDKSLF